MLSPFQLTQIQQLQERCEKEEQILLKLNWDLLNTRKKSEKRDFFYEDNGQLVGFLGLYSFGSKVEICGMVHPEYRNRGIFSTLLKEALAICDSENISTILLNAPAASESAKKFLQNRSFSYRFSEYEMQWEETSLNSTEDVVIRKATKEDLPLEIELDVRCFQFSQKDALEYNERIKKENTQSFYMIEHAGVTVGKMRLDYTNEEAWIYGFAILPEYQGKGIGRKALVNMVMAEQEKERPVFLEVEATNKHALKLYNDCGFKPYSVQDYYERRR
ncbi:GNAT family N-acetyltransferase [Bacillus spongiae]|uniref:GNAT family N-acetyltransferase n=1 Tax=Bacillus spongiae TaxID=2683610 RepID=A0ABU8HBU6_9BACI